MEHLSALGHERVAFVGGRMDVLATYEKAVRCRQLCRTGGIEYGESMAAGEGGYDFKSGYEQMNGLLDGGERPTAVIAVNDFAAFGIMRSIREHGLGIPGDISLVSFDNTYMAESANPKLTSVDYNYTKYGETLVDTAIRLIEGREVERIQMVERELTEVRKQRAVQQKRKLKGGLPLISLVGYTNAGKSSLLNTLTDEQIYAEDQLFATLDPTTRAFYLPGGSKALLTDTVGFIRDLPPQLIEAFKATLDELQYADLLLHVVDLSNSNFQNQLQEVEEILLQLNLQEKPRIFVFNKIDMLDELPSVGQGLERESCCYVSAVSGQGIPALLEMMEARLIKTVSCKVQLPVAEGRLLYKAYETGSVRDLEYTEAGICFTWSGRGEKVPPEFAEFCL